MKKLLLTTIVTLIVSIGSSSDSKGATLQRSINLALNTQVRNASPNQSSHQEGNITYSPAPGYEEEFIALQKSIVTRYGGADGLKNAVKDGYIVPTHLGAVVTGNGLALANASELLEFIAPDADLPHSEMDLQKPMLLMYAPTGNPGPTPAGKEGTFDDIWLDEPYELIGWNYGSDYDPADHPHLDGIPDEAWFVHEAGWHMSDGTMVLTPPQEDYPGQLPQEAPSGPAPVVGKVGEGDFAVGIVPHPRAWDVHIWRNPNLEEVPSISMNEPFQQLPDGTLDMPEGAFFYPQTTKE